jgi:hypothetical protein
MQPEGSVRFRGLCIWLVKCLSLYSEELLALSPTSSWRTTPCRLSATAYSIYSQLLSISGGRSSIRNLRTRMSWWGTHLSRSLFFVLTVLPGDRVQNHTLWLRSDWLLVFHLNTLQFTKHIWWGGSDLLALQHGSQVSSSWMTSGHSTV